MATRVAPTPPDADNPAGSFTLAACNDWRFGVRRFHVGTGHHQPTHDAGYTTAGSPSRPPLSISLLLPRGSPYTWLGGSNHGIHCRSRASKGRRIRLPGVG